MNTTQNSAADHIHKDEAKPVCSLECCCCGGEARGRQWWNRDTGYGLCRSCGDMISGKHGYREAENMAGLRGVHWDVKPC